MNPLAAGTVSGCVATLPMSLMMLDTHRRLPVWERYALPPHQITARFLGRLGVRWKLDGDAKRAAAWVNHFLFGAAAGAIYGPLARRVPLHPAIRGTIFGLGVWTVSYLGWLPAAGLLGPATRHPPRRTALMIGAHVIWGAATGLLTAWLAGRSGRAGVRFDDAPVRADGAANTL